MHPKRGLTQVIALMIGCLLVMLIVFISVNWTYMSTDAISGTRNNVFYQDEVRNIPVFPTMPVLNPISLVTSRDSHGSSVQQTATIQTIKTQSEMENSPGSTDERISDVSAKDLLNKKYSDKDSEVPAHEVGSSQHDLFDTVLDKMSLQERVSASQSLRSGEQPVEERLSCSGTQLAQSVEKSDFFHLSDFDCSSTDEGWDRHIPPPATNSTRAKRLWLKRRNLLAEFSDQQNNFDFSDPNSKYIVFWPIFAGIGNNLAVFAEVMLIAMLSNRKFLVYDWDTLRGYFYLPFQFEVIKEKGTIFGIPIFSVGARSGHAVCGEDEPVSVRRCGRVPRQGRGPFYRDAVDVSDGAAADQGALGQVVADGPRSAREDADQPPGDGAPRPALPLPRGDGAASVGAGADRRVQAVGGVERALRHRRARAHGGRESRGHSLGSVSERGGRAGVQGVRQRADLLVRERGCAGHESETRRPRRGGSDRAENEGGRPGAVVRRVGPGADQGAVQERVRELRGVHELRDETHQQRKAEKGGSRLHLRSR